MKNKEGYIVVHYMTGVKGYEKIYLRRPKYSNLPQHHTTKVVYKKSKLLRNRLKDLGLL